MDAFGTRGDWSTWSGIDIGRRIVHLLNNKMDGKILKSSPLEKSRVPNNLSCPVKSDYMSCFFNTTDPPISLEDYIGRLVYYTRLSVSPVNLAVALFYLDRIERLGLCEISKYTIYRLFSVAYLIAFKHMEDLTVMRNSDYCKISGMSLNELNQLELSFLRAIDFHLCVGDDIAVAQQITRILVPTKISPVILICEKASPSVHTHSFTPDSVAYIQGCSSPFSREIGEGCETSNTFDKQYMW